MADPDPGAAAQRFHEQHARRGRADPDRGAARALDGRGAVQAADPAVLHRDSGRALHADRHVDEPACRWCGARARSMTSRSTCFRMT